MTFRWHDPDEIRVKWLATNPSRSTIQSVFEWFLDAMRDPNGVTFDEIDGVRVSSVGGVTVVWIVLRPIEELGLIDIRQRL